MNSCVFYNENGECKALKEMNCNGCKFKKNRFEFDDGVKNAERILEKRGLEPCQKRLKDGTVIMTTKKGWWLER